MLRKIALAFAVAALAAAHAQGVDADSLLRAAIGLASQGEWTKAGSALEEGMRLFPHDVRFPSEMAGVAFRTGRRQVAKQYLNRALAIDPGDKYANDFLGTLYMLDGNLEAGLRYWNRIGKPRVDRVLLDSTGRSIPAAAQHALAVPSGDVFSQSRLLATKSALDRLGIYPAYRLSLAPAPGTDNFDLSFRPAEASPTLWQRALGVAAELPYETVHFGMTNVSNSGTSFDALWRWAPDRRRIAGSLAFPFAGNPNLLARVSIDQRDENWNVRSSRDVFGLKKVEFGALLDYGVTGRLSWLNGVSVSARSFAEPAAGAGRGLFAAGSALQLQSGLRYAAVRIPENSFFVDLGTNVQGGPGPGGTFSKVQASATARWNPTDVLGFRSALSAGKTFGATPFDELYFLGMDYDTDLWMRGHVVTRNGEKGAGPIGRGYVISQNDFSPAVYRSSLLRAELGPFLDVGRAMSPLPGSPLGWMVDTGAQLKLKVAGGLSFTVVAGFDTRTGRSAIFTRVGR